MSEGNTEILGNKSEKEVPQIGTIITKNNLKAIIKYLKSHKAKSPNNRPVITTLLTTSRSNKLVDTSYGKINLDLITSDGQGKNKISGLKNANIESSLTRLSIAHDVYIHAEVENILNFVNSFNPEEAIEFEGGSFEGVGMEVFVQLIQNGILRAIPEDVDMSNPTEPQPINYLMGYWNTFTGNGNIKRSKSNFEKTIRSATLSMALSQQLEKSIFGKILIKQIGDIISNIASKHKPVTGYRKMEINDYEVKIPRNKEGAIRRDGSLQNETIFAASVLNTFYFETYDGFKATVFQNLPVDGSGLDYNELLQEFLSTPNKSVTTETVRLNLGLLTQEEYDIEQQKFYKTLNPAYLRQEADRIESMLFKDDINTYPKD
jgi:hypothetical protein